MDALRALDPDAEEEPEETEFKAVTPWYGHDVSLLLTLTRQVPKLKETLEEELERICVCGKNVMNCPCGKIRQALSSFDKALSSSLSDDE